MRIAKPILLVSTPLGVGWGVIEAARFHLWLAALMVVLVGVIALLFWMTVRRIRAERDSFSRGPPADAAPPQAAAPPAHRS